MPPFLNCLVSRVFELRICVRKKIKTKNKNHWMNIKSDNEAHVCSHIHMTYIQCERKLLGMRREQSQIGGCVCVSLSLESPSGNVVEIQNHTNTPLLRKMFGHSFVPFKVSTKTSTAKSVCELDVCVWWCSFSLIFHFFLNWLLPSPRWEGSKVQKRRLPIGFPSISNSYLAHLTTVK